MKIDELLKKEMQNPEFASAYTLDKERSAATLALYHAREAAGLTQADLATCRCTTDNDCSNRTGR